MVTSTARVPSDRPERYVKQLVSHLARKRNTHLIAPDAGSIEWPDGHCGLACEPGALVLTATADDDEAMARIQDVVSRHLERFGARDDLRVDWT